MGCTGTCTPMMSGYTQDIMQYMITATFGFGSGIQGNTQQTRHTLTNKIIMFQNASKIVVEYSNSLERFIGGVAYDGSFFLYEATLLKIDGLWKYKSIHTITQGNGHLNTGNPGLPEWNPWMVGINNYTGSTDTLKYRRELSSHRRLEGPGKATNASVFVGGSTVSLGMIASDVVAPNIQLDPLQSRIPKGALDAMASNDIATAVTMAWDRAEIIERLGMYPFLADEMRRNQPLGYLWGDLYSDGSYFCEYGYYDVSVIRPTWAELEPTYPGIFGGAVTSVPPGSGITSSCAYGLGTYAQEALQEFASGFGAGGPFQQYGQQTRHTFSNFVFLNQTATDAATLNYNIVERYVNGIAMDGSSFLYHMKWGKISGYWQNQGARCIIFGHDRLGAAPSPAEFSAWLTYIRGVPFI